MAISPKRGRLSSDVAATFKAVLRTTVALAALSLVLTAASQAGLTRAESSVLHQMNRTRAAHGLHLLVYDRHLERAAEAHTDVMLRTNVFAHGAFASRLLQFDVAARVAGENLAWAAGTKASARNIVGAWLASPAHRANLLKPSFRRVGIGALDGAFQGFAHARVVTADFAG